MTLTVVQVVIWSIQAMVWLLSGMLQRLPVTSKPLSLCLWEPTINFVGKRGQDLYKQDIGQRLRYGLGFQYVPFLKTATMIPNVGFSSTQFDVDVDRQPVPSWLCNGSGKLKDHLGPS